MYIFCDIIGHKEEIKLSSRINIRIDEELKNDVQEILGEMGMDMSTAVTILFKEIRRTHEYPFKPSAKSSIAEALDDIEQGRLNNYEDIEAWKQAMKEL